jgi:hypothetical protein
VTLSAASMYIAPGPCSRSGNTSKSWKYNSGMKDLQVLKIINFLKPSREQVASIRTNLIIQGITLFIKVLTQISFALARLYVSKNYENFKQCLIHDNKHFGLCYRTNSILKIYFISSQ